MDAVAASLAETSIASGVGTYLSGTARAVPLLKVGRLIMHFAVPFFGHRLHIALMIDDGDKHFGPDLPSMFKMNEIW